MATPPLPPSCPVDDCGYVNDEKKRLARHIRSAHQPSEIPVGFRKKYKFSPCAHCGHLFQQMNVHTRSCKSIPKNSSTSSSSAKASVVVAASDHVPRPKKASHSSSKVSSSSSSTTNSLPLPTVTLPPSTASSSPVSIPDCSTTPSSELSDPRSLTLCDPIDGVEFLSSLDFADISCHSSPSVERIPVNLHTLFLECCQLSFRYILSDPDGENSWKLLFLLPRLLLQPFPRPSHLMNAGPDRRSRLQWFLGRRWHELYQHSAPVDQFTPRSCPPLDEDDSHDDVSLPPQVLDAVEKKVRHGEISRAANLLTSSGLASPSDETFRKLQEKHPPASSAVTRASVDTPPVQASAVALRSVLRGSPRGSGPGCDGWRFEHFRLLLDDDAVLTNFLQVCNLFLAGRIPTPASTAFAGARLIALRKNASDVRPIAIGSAFRRCVAKLALSLRKEQIAAFFSPFQFGVATPGGAEHLVHLLQLCASQHPNWIILKTDAKNAFNSVSRPQFLRQVAQHFPALYAFVSACYIVPPALSFLHSDGVRCIQSAEGVQQGDPMGPFLFALALQPCLQSASRGVSPGMVMSYLDDAVIAGPKDQVVSAFSTLQNSMKEIGLIIRPDKCEAFSFVDDPDWSLADIPFTTSGLSILGCPVGSRAFAGEFCSRFVEKQDRFLTQLRRLTSHQTAMLLLRYCGVTSINHLLRATPPSFIRLAASQFDSNIQAAFQSIIGCQLQVPEVRQIRLRLSQGGMGLSSAVLTSPCAFLGSWAASLAALPARLGELQSEMPDVAVVALSGLYDGHLHSTLSSLQQKFPSIASDFPSLQSLCDAPQKLQKRLTSECLSAELEDLLDSVPTASRARLRSAGCPEAGAWLDAIPESRELTFSNAEFQTAVSLRLGLDVPMLRQIQLCNCGVACDARGYHVMTCPKDGGAIRRHDAVQDIWFRMLRSVNFRCELEKSNEFADKKRPDIGVYNFDQGKKILLDVSITHPLAVNIQPQAANVSGFAAGQKDQRKIEKYRAVAGSLGYLFDPLVMEVYGRWSPIARDFFRKAAVRPSIDFVNDRAAFVNFWRKRLSVGLQRGNATIILNKIKAIFPCSATRITSLPANTDIRCFGGVLQ